ncbi:peptidoglycan-binding domain-containing protein [Nodularia harveyana UHCC-0300]|uniref:Peptidoglycan-binding domain-containing protein n=1 Tax=Nodularia harveyana UHCC-0300 TaxID=2974287 RepID=A0ABU5U955_9CYAN|nr:peptidoglycan-binding domain-containing protein [Nodularia harveyana]MEA5580037.1 peptidoglycan-binding domain-containing protein [Nodularia harveyana UHCC-0300]
MSEIGLLITGILTARQLLPNKLPKQQPFQVENSSERLTKQKLTPLVNNSPITPPEFMPTDAVLTKTFSGSQLGADKLLDKIKNRQLSPVSLTLAKQQPTPNIKQNSMKLAARSPTYTGGRSLPTLRFGSYGTPVRVLQRLLVTNGYAIRVDGAFGPLTETAVKAFQNQRRVGVDGVVGPVTWQKLTI